MSYYDRPKIIQPDGSHLYCIDQYKKYENEVRIIIEKAWQCQLNPFGSLSPIDFYALKNGVMVGIVEVKSRSHDSNKFPTVFLNLRKWLALTLGATGFGVPAIYVIKFTDEIKFININEVDATKIKIGGCSRYLKSQSDIEPVIEIPIKKMKAIPQ